MRDQIIKYIDEHISGIRRNCLYLLLISAVATLFSSVTLMTELEHDNKDYKELQRQALVASSYYQQELISNSIKLTQIHSRNLRDEISENLGHDYPEDLEELRVDLDNYFTIGVAENKVYKNISGTSYAYLKKWFSNVTNIRLAIVGKTHVYFTSDSVDPLRYQRNLAQLFNMPSGTVAVINKVSGEIRVMYPEMIPSNVEDLSSVYIMTPAYIYDYTDAFGVPNTNPDGTAADNSTLAVIVAIQPLSNENLHRINDFNAILSKERLGTTSVIIAKGLINIALSCGMMILIGVVYTVLRARQKKLSTRIGGDFDSNE